VKRLTPTAEPAQMTGEQNPTAYREYRPVPDRCLDWTPLKFQRNSRRKESDLPGRAPGEREPRGAPTVWRVFNAPASDQA